MSKTNVDCGNAAKVSTYYSSESPRDLTSVTTSLTRSSAPWATFPRASITPSRVSLALFDITTTVGGLMAESYELLTAATGAALTLLHQSPITLQPDALRLQRTTLSLSLNHTRPTNPNPAKIDILFCLRSPFIFPGDLAVVLKLMPAATSTVLPETAKIDRPCAARTVRASPR